MSYRFRRHETRQHQLDFLRRKGWQILTIKTAPAVVAFHSINGSMFVKLWRGNADKPAFYHSFASVEQAEAYVKSYLAKMAEVTAYQKGQQAERKAKRAALKASDHWAIGDVLYNSWGYEQTNIDWYQVVELKPKSIVIRPIMKNYGATAWLQGKSQPRRNEFCGEPILKPLDEQGRISMRHGAATKWDGRPVSESSYH